MKRYRYLLIILVALLVMITVVATRLYEYVIMLETPSQALVRAGYQKFRKATNGFNFRYPIGWKYVQQVNTDDFINGFFYDLNGTEQLYLEAPYSGHEFIFTYKKNKPFFSPTPKGELYQVAAVSSSIITTNEAKSPLVVHIYRPCVFASPTSECAAASQGGFIVAVWQRGETKPFLNIDNDSANGGVFYAKLPNDIGQEKFKIDQFISVVNSFRFNNIGDNLSVTSTRWLVYHNNQFGYSFSYPANYSLAENQNLSFAFMDNGTILDFPSSMISGTNLSEAKILFGNVLPADAGENCLPNNGITTPPEQKIINGVKFYKSVGAGAAAGNRYDTITYALNHNGSCLNITLFLHSTVLENYDENNRPAPFDHDLIVSDFNNIFNTLILY